MTTTVIVKAHCASDKEVYVTMNDNGVMSADVLQDGETIEKVVYDNKSITVQEINKATTTSN